MSRPLTLTEKAVVILNHKALFMHYSAFQARLARLVKRMIGG